MVIKRAQIQKLDEILFESFVAEMTDLLTGTPFADGENRTLKTIVETQSRRATREFKITEKKYLFEFVRLSVFYETLRTKTYADELRDILTWPDRSSELKIELLKQYLSQ